MIFRKFLKQRKSGLNRKVIRSNPTNEVRQVLRNFKGKNTRGLEIGDSGFRNIRQDLERRGFKEPIRTKVDKFLIPDPFGIDELVLQKNGQRFRFSRLGYARRIKGGKNIQID